jgi:hypothetical protein
VWVSTMEWFVSKISTFSYVLWPVTFEFENFPSLDYGYLSHHGFLAIWDPYESRPIVPEPASV